MAAADEAPDAASRGEDVELVWSAASALGPRDASVLDLHLRHLETLSEPDPAEAGEALFADN